MTTKGVKILWKTDGENHRIYDVFCDFWVPLGVHFGDQGQHKKQNKGVFLVTFSGVGSGRILECFLVLFGCFLDAFWMLFGILLVAFWEPFGTGLLELLGSCGKDLGCFFLCFFIKFLVFIQPVLSNVGECRGLGGWGGV